MAKHNEERHRSDRVGWLRAAVLGANDGVVSTASLLVGVASASDSTAHGIVLAGVAGLVGGALSMAAGEYVSVSSQADSEAADLAVEREELATAPEQELRELAGIYLKRGLTSELANQVARALMAKDALGAHARDELGIMESTRARPLQAAAASALAFSVGALLPLGTTLLAPRMLIVWIVGGVSLVCLGVLGAVAARIGGGSAWKSAARVLIWSSLAFGVSNLVGRAFTAFS